MGQEGGARRCMGTDVPRVVIRTDLFLYKTLHTPGFLTTGEGEDPRVEPSALRFLPRPLVGLQLEV